MTFASDADFRLCREAIRAGSKTFYAASLLLPRGVRRPAYGLYAFCRLSDDAVDVGGGSEQALVRLRERLARAYDGRPFDEPADRALADLVHDYAIPRTVPEALLEGLAWDIEGRRFATISQLTDYAARVAGSVGVMMTLIMGPREPQVLARACDLGVAMQLTNIARDVGEDARNGRLYLPLDWLAEAGVETEGFLARPLATPALKAVVARLLAEADRLYARAISGVAALPPMCRPAIAAAAILYAEIGREVERNGLDSVSVRARVTGKRKVALLARALGASAAARASAATPALSEVAYLIQAVAETRAGPLSERPNYVRRVTRFLDLIEKLERHEQQFARQGATQ